MNITIDCITITSLKILWNGESTDPIYPSRGIHQEDPLSPYIFVLCLERLTQLRHGVPISHLLFANDMLLFAEANTYQMEVIKNCLDSFCQVSRQKVSIAKTRVLFSRNVSVQQVQNINRVCGCKLQTWECISTCHYYSKKIPKTTYHYILDQIHSQLSG